MKKLEQVRKQLDYIGSEQQRMDRVYEQLAEVKRRAEEIGAEKVEISPPAWWQWPIIWWRKLRGEE